MTHPNFIIGLLSYLMFLIGVTILIYDSDLGMQVILLSIAMGGVHWVGSIINVCTDSELKHDERSWFLWLAIVIMVPPVAGMMYYMMDRKILSF